MENCIFCKISSGEISTKFEYEDEEIVAFNDIHPKAPVHILIIPKKHIKSINDLKDEDQALVGKIILISRNLAQKKGIDQTGFRLVSNAGINSGQEVSHLHFHLLGGRQLGPMA